MTTDSVPTITTYTTTVTPAQAAFWLKSLSYERQRDVRKQHVATLKLAILRGELKVLELRIARLPDGTGRIIDGQHRLHALIQAGMPLPALVIEYACANERQVAELYSTFDRPQRRNYYDSFKAFGLAEKLGLKKHDAGSFIAAIPLLMSRFGPSDGAMLEMKSPAARALVAEDWTLEAVELFALFNPASKPTRQLLERAPVVAVALATMRYQESLAREFWSAIARDEGLVRTDPAWKMLDWLRTTPAKRMTQHLYARYVATAWNAYYEGRPLEKMIVKTATVNILGTPYNGSRREVGL